MEQGGVIKVQQAGTVSTFLNLSALVDSTGERGLLGLAFAPDCATSGRFDRRTSAVPEPAALLLMTGGLLALWGRRLKRVD